MKSSIRLFTLAFLFSAFSHIYGQEPEPSYFSFVNAINTDAPTTLSVNGTKIGNPFPCGFYTGGMGFMDRTAVVTVKNGDLADKTATLLLDPQTSPILIAYLKTVMPPAGSNAPPKKSIALILVPCSTAEKSANLRAVYVGNENSLAVTVKNIRRGTPAAATPGTTMNLKPGVPMEVPVKRSPLQFLVGETLVGAHDAEGNENYLLVFFRMADGKLAVTETLDFLPR